jgi:hypothetical protein
MPLSTLAGFGEFDGSDLEGESSCLSWVCPRAISVMSRKAKVTSNLRLVIESLDCLEEFVNVVPLE